MKRTITQNLAVTALLVALTLCFDPGVPPVWGAGEAPRPASGSPLAQAREDYRVQSEKLRNAEAKIAELERRNTDQQKQMEDLNAKLNQKKNAESAKTEATATAKTPPASPTKEVKQKSRKRQDATDAKKTRKTTKMTSAHSPEPQKPEAAQRQSPVVDKRRNEARKVFEAAENLYNQGEYDWAILEYQKIISYYDSDPLIPKALFRQGMAFEKLGDDQTAKIIYRKLLHEYEGTPEAIRAQERLNRLEGRPDVMLPVAGQPWTNSIGMQFVAIPAGTFMMGCTSEREPCSDDEKPRHQVTISKPFHLGKYEVTQAQWVAVMGTNRSAFEGADHPVERVSWNDAQEFIMRLNAREGHNRYRLPTEAEWEFSARGLRETVYSFGNDARLLGYHAWYRGNFTGLFLFAQTHPVGRKWGNDWGLYDMEGNVSEWVEDWFDASYYRSGATVDPRGPSAGEDRVIRGCDKDAWDCRATVRFRRLPGYRSSGVGFRLAISPEP